MQLLASLGANARANARAHVRRGCEISGANAQIVAQLRVWGGCWWVLQNIAHAIAIKYICQDHNGQSTTALGTKSWCTSGVVQPWQMANRDRGKGIMKSRMLSVMQENEAHYPSLGVYLAHLFLI